ncbi:MAG: 2OG-Fe(II) oxygenase [Myxococcota bacterium]
MNPESLFGTEPCPFVQIYDEGRVITIPGLLDDAQCTALKAWTARHEWETEAPITTAQGFVAAPNVRNNARLIVDEEAWANQLWLRLGPVFAELLPGVPGIGINERFRFYRYGPGQYFRDHYDGSYRRPGTNEESMFTLMIYLSEVEKGWLTRFHDAEVAVTPEPGLACAFLHRQLHEGEEVLQGEKWVLRTDVMFDLTSIR